MKKTKLLLTAIIVILLTLTSCSLIDQLKENSEKATAFSEASGTYYAYDYMNDVFYPEGSSEYHKLIVYSGGDGYLDGKSIKEIDYLGTSELGYKFAFKLNGTRYEFQYSTSGKNILFTAGLNCLMEEKH